MITGFLEVQWESIVTALKPQSFEASDAFWCEQSALNTSRRSILPSSMVTGGGAQDAQWLVRVRWGHPDDCFSGRQTHHQGAWVRAKEGNYQKKQIAD
jgi:hypothetical protein